jgi:hypothetical protein
MQLSNESYESDRQEQFSPLLIVFSFFL